jgi:hypothetical protein
MGIIFGLSGINIKDGKSGKMMEKTQNNSIRQELSKKDAESVATAINLLLGNVKMFGDKHPSTGHAADDLCQKINNLTSEIPMITLIRSGNSFYIEKWLVDKQINHAKHTKEFDSLQIESISFMSNVLPWNITAFAQFYIEALDADKTANNITEQMEASGQKGIVLNNIVIKTVAKNEEKVIDKAHELQKEVVKTEEMLDKDKFLPLLSPKATVHFIKRYIEEFFRHKHPFSIVIISDKEKKPDGISPLSSAISEIIAKGFRFLDISGFVHIRGKDIAVIIFPMTDTEGLKAILSRLNKKTKENHLTLTSTTISEESSEKDVKALSYANIMKKLLQEHI